MHPYTILGLSACITAAMAQGGEILPQTSPAFLADVPRPTGVATSAPQKPYPTGALDMNFKLDLKKYPTTKEVPPVNNEEVKKAIAAIDWSKVPKIAPRKKLATGDLDVKSYDNIKDPDCWWSATICKQPKLSYIPPDYYQCPTAGDWGLNYDDGPLNPFHFDAPEEWAEPALYDALTKQNQTATLFYIGSYVVTYPTAAQRALNSGNVLCSHTWSHKQMTTLTNEQLVAEFYWSLKSIKEATGVTVKCWRPPFGDVDDRVRAIAHQMGMRTFIWDQDSFDWNIGPNTPTSKVDGYFEKWISARTGNQDNEHGHVTLQHELNADTVHNAIKWLPQVTKNFNVMPIHQCLDDTSPYWEESFVYPKRDGTVPANAATTNSTSTGTNSGETKDSTGNAGAVTSNESGASHLQLTVLPGMITLAMVYNFFM
ncbi:hypothetical protein INT43_008677 [Umbelopsis isabellina]|uniref:NodB homology domain-containing protein n=1 Tax=Mortierella isabellina TaxID=91625 RepID=A0A8H7PWN1_MORIS|nr:hypothetical protein INT43_008677 [Umbelopsis isabellina]